MLIEPVVPDVVSVAFATVTKPAKLINAGVDEPTDSIAPGAVLPIPTFPLASTNKAVNTPASPPGLLRIFNVPLSRMLNVWAVPAPLKDRLAESDADPVTSKAVRGVVLPMPTLCDESILRASVPPVEKLTVFAPDDHMPVSGSLVPEDWKV